MMELIKKRIHRNKRKSQVMSQMVLDEDFNVPDSMDDVEELILDGGEPVIESVRNQGEKVLIRGMLAFRVLYRTPVGQVMTLAGNLPFEETVNLPGVEDTDAIQVSWEMDDRNIGLIHSRKLSVKALITLQVQTESIEDMEIVSDVHADGSAETLKQETEAAVLAVQRKDTFRVREMLTVSGNRPDIERILWQEMKLRNVSTKAVDGGMQIEGDLMVFLIYAGADMQMPIQYLEEMIPFSGCVELAEAREDMIPFVTVKLAHKELEVTPDLDGEMREAAADAVLELDIRLYAEEKVETLCDLYALDREVIPEKKEICFDQIAAKHVQKHKIQEKTPIPGQMRVLQVCHCDGSVKLDEVRMCENGIQVDGVLTAEVLTLTADDAAPISAFTEMIPFQIHADIPGVREDSTYQILPTVEHVSAMMTGGDAVEIKAAVSVDLLIMNQICESVITQVREEPLDLEHLKRMPWIVGYVVRSGDTLWKIAREFHTSVEEIMSANHLSSSEIRPGQKLLLIKAVRERIGD